MQRAVLGVCGLGLSLLAGCFIIPGDPATDPPVDPPVDASPPPVDAPPPPVDGSPVDAIPLPPPPVAANVHVDAYDPVNHRVLVGDCLTNEVLSQDATTGERTVLVATWPWTEPGSTSCVREIMVQRDGLRAYATVSRQFQHPEASDQTCVASEFVSIDTSTGEVTPLRNIAYSCGEGGSSALYSVQFDAYYQRLLHLSDSCNPNWCDHNISATDLGTGDVSSVHDLYPLPCFPDDEGCVIESRTAPIALTFDPVQPDKRILVFARNRPNSGNPGAPFIESIDTATGEVAETIEIQSTWDLLGHTWDKTTVGGVEDVSLDPENWRVLVTVVGGEERGPTRGEPRWMVISINRYTGEQTMLYFGTPTADGAKLACSPDVSFDTRGNRLLMIEPPGGYGCQGGSFALDLATSTLSHL